MIPSTNNWNQHLFIRYANEDILHSIDREEPIHNAPCHRLIDANRVRSFCKQLHHQSVHGTITRFTHLFRADRSDSDFTFDSILVSWSIWKCLDICNMKSMDLIQSIALSAHWMLFTTLCHVFIISSVSEAKVSTPIISSVYEAKVPRQLFPPQHPVLLSSFHKSFCVSSDGLPLWH